MRRIPVFVGLWLAGISTLAQSPSVSELHAIGSALEYNLDLPEAQRRFREAAEVEPTNPAAYRAAATTYLWEIFLRRGAMTTDDLLDDMPTDTMRVMPPPAELAAGFRKQAERALALAEERLRGCPTDADAHYQVGSAVALLASYAASVDGRVLEAFKFGRRAYQENGAALAADPGRADAGLIVGLYEYILSVRGFPVRWFARVAGVNSDKARGIRLVEAAARYPGENQTDARLALVVIYNREQRYDEAITILTDLQQRYPRNRFLWLEAGATALRARRARESEQFLSAGLNKLAEDPRPRARGEDALWHYKRGAARVMLGQQSGAAADLQQALAADARPRIRGRTHTELGKLADMRGERAEAIHRYENAIQIGTADGDVAGVAEARRWRKAAYRSSQSRQ